MRLDLFCDAHATYCCQRPECRRPAPRRMSRQEIEAWLIVVAIIVCMAVGHRYGLDR